MYKLMLSTGNFFTYCLIYDNFDFAPNKDGDAHCFKNNKKLIKFLTSQHPLAFCLNSEVRELYEIYRYPVS